MLSIGMCAQVACVWEATARKPGNVTRFTDFADTSYLDFVLSAAAVAPILDGACRRPVGQTVLEAVRATRQVVRSNTNLGIILLLAPLATVPADEELQSGLRRVLDGLDGADSRLVYEAIRLARPAGLGQVADQDVQAEPSLPLRAAMQLAADRDLIARQYVTSFGAIFDEGVPALRHGLGHSGSVENAIIYCHLRWLTAYPDSLIARKRGPTEAADAGQRAAEVLDAGWPHTALGRRRLDDLDAWLRAEGNGRNPGTTADLVTACLFVALRTGILNVTSSIPWCARADHD